MYGIEGKDILDICELSHAGDDRLKAPFNTEDFRFEGAQRAVHAPSNQLILWAPDFIYSDNGIGTEFRHNGETLYAARRGTRPSMNVIYTQRGPGVWYINKFVDGEMWVSTTANTRSGTRISTKEADIKYLFVEIVAGGGGGGGAGTLQSASGGGAGGYSHSCIRPPVGSYAKVTVGNGGTFGTAAGAGGNGENSVIDCYNYSTTCVGGTGGPANGKTGGEGGIAAAISNVSHGYGLNMRQGGAGGITSGTRRGENFHSIIYNYSPEAQKIERKYESGYSENASGWGGSGGASGLGAGGDASKGASGSGGVGGDGKGFGSGGAGGGNYVWGRRDGGAGAPGGFILYY